MWIFRPEFSSLALYRNGMDARGMLDKNPGRGRPSVRRGKFDAILPRNLQRVQAGRAQILIQDADRG